MPKIDLKNTTLVSITSNKVEETLKAFDICKLNIDFYKIILFTDVSTEYTHKIKTINSIVEYNEFSYYALPQYIDSDFVLTIHWDGFVVNSDNWTNDFFLYDYIGAPWPWNNMCGNSGFCLRSKKFLKAQHVLSKKFKLEIDKKYGKDALHDDVMMCLKIRDKFVDLDCRYATSDIGYKFSTEYGAYDNHNSFGFHDFRQQPQFKKLIYG